MSRARSAPAVGGRHGRHPSNPGNSRRPKDRSPGASQAVTARTVGGLFFPQSQALGLDRTEQSPKVQQKIVYAGAKSTSFAQAARDLARLAELSVPVKQVERLTRRIGQERIEQREAAVDAFQARPLMQKDGLAHPQRPAPAVAMVSVDGGRLQIRSDPATSDAPGPARHWRESKVAVLETYLSAQFEQDPDPDVPRCFLDLGRTARLVRGLGHALPTGLPELSAEAKAETETETETEAEAETSCVEGSRRAERPGRPVRLVRSLLASRADAAHFGPMVHEAAWQRNFFGARQRAFLGDGQAANWTIHRIHFSTFEPILDFVHALCYLFAAALAGRDVIEGQAVYRRWVQLAWAGRIETLLPELERRSTELGIPPPECPESDPRQLVFEALRYLKNHASRMRYAEYRCRGLPIMTCAVESAIKQINRRVKGSEKFWSEPGAEAILQLRADYLSETEPMERFWSAREATATGQRPYRQAV
jgi:hypothetical protein